MTETISNITKITDLELNQGKFVYCSKNNYAGKTRCRNKAIYICDAKLLCLTHARIYALETMLQRKNTVERTSKLGTIKIGQHVHVAVDKSDNCLRCNKNFRDTIHARWF